MEKRTKHTLTIDQKQEICLFHQKNPTVEYLGIIRLFSAKFKLDHPLPSKVLLLVDNFSGH